MEMKSWIRRVRSEYSQSKLTEMVRNVESAWAAVTDRRNVLLCICSGSKIHDLASSQQEQVVEELVNVRSVRR
jgi:hypothetical protein